MAEMHTQPGGYETRDVSVKLFGMIILGMLSVTLLGMAISLWFFNTSSERAKTRDVPPPPLAGTLPQQPPEPRLQENPGADLQSYKASEAEILETYDWIDSQGGIVRIPIERAMDLVAQRGLPVRGETPPAAPAKRR